MVGCCRGESISKLIWPWSSNSRFPSVLAIPNRYPTRALFAGDDLCNCRDSDELHASRRFITSCHLNPPRFGPKTGDSKVRPATRDSKRSTFSTVHSIDKEVSTRRVSNRMFSTTWWEPFDMMMLKDAHEINYRHTRRQAILSTGHLYLTKPKEKGLQWLSLAFVRFRLPYVLPTIERIEFQEETYAVEPVPMGLEVSGPLSFREFRFISAPSTSLKINIRNVHIYYLGFGRHILYMKHESQIVEGEQTITSKAAGHIYIHLRHDVQLTISLSKQLDSTYFCLNRKYTGCKAVQSYFYGM